MRLIDADALLNRMQEDPLFDLVERYGVSGVIEAEPTVDAVPVRHGSWIIDHHSQHGFPLHIYLKRICSECGHSVDYPTPYCPLCGAKMVAERREE